MRSLERLDAFVLARELAVRIYRTTRTRPLSEHSGLADQISRAAVSIPANIAEAYGLGTTPQLVRGLRIAYGSSLELQTQLRIARRSGALSSGAESRRLLEDLDRVVQMLVGLLKHYGADVNS